MNVLLHGHTHDGRLQRLPSGLVALSTGSAAVTAEARPAEVPNQYQLVTIGPGGITRYARQYAVGQRRWIGDTRVSPTGSDWRDHQPVQLGDVGQTFAAVTPTSPLDGAGFKGRRSTRDLESDHDDFLARVAEATRARLPRERRSRCGGERDICASPIRSRRALVCCSGRWA